MKRKLIIPLIILALVFGISPLLMAQGSHQGGAVEPGSSPNTASQQAAPKGQAAAKKSDSKAAVSPLSHKVIAYYFYGNVRCPSCKKIEAYSHEAIQGGFAAPLKDGRLEWRPINVEESGNEHFLKDFQIYTKSLVIVDLIDGKQKQWKNLPKVWELLYDKDGFIKYVRDEINAYLTGRT